jgi:hypothetical protein
LSNDKGKPSCLCWLQCAVHRTHFSAGHCATNP